MKPNTTLHSYDEALLRQAFDAARRAREGGDHPFGAVLGDAEGRLLLTQGNGYSAEGGDRTAHAERLLASRAAKAYRLEELATMTLYTSAEPCAIPPASSAADTPTSLASLASHVLTAAAGNPCAARNVATVSGAVAAMSCVMRDVHA